MRFAPAAECGIIAGKMSKYEGFQMKLHYMGKYNLDPDSLPHGEHKPGAMCTCTRTFCRECCSLSARMI